jgi:hypothetical protein
MISARTKPRSQPPSDQACSSAVIAVLDPQPSSERSLLPCARIERTPGQQT